MPNSHLNLPGKNECPRAPMVVVVSKMSASQLEFESEEFVFQPHFQKIFPTSLLAQGKF